MVNTHTHVISAHKDGAIEAAVEQLIAGNLVALPTETVYGLAADALNDKAVTKIYRAKGRPSNNPLICHVANATMAADYVILDDIAKKMIHLFWPGPLTLVLPQRQNNAVPAIVSASLPTLAIRCPATDITREIIEKLGRPIAAPSANASGKLSPTTAQDVLETLDGRLPLILDGGQTRIGIESTIVSIVDGKITLLRPGSVTVDDISQKIGHPVFDRDKQQITAPGQLQSHYAPNAAVRLNAKEKKQGETHIGFADIHGDYTLSAAGDLVEAAHALFSTLRKADHKGSHTIAVAPIPNTGIGIAINDRLKRAAAPREV